MAITITLPLLPVHFSRNAIDVEFTCPDKFITAGALYRITLYFSTNPDTDGDTLEFTYVKNGESISRLWTFRTTPDPDLYEILKYPGSGIEAWLNDHVLPGIQSDPQIAQDFTLSVVFTDPIYQISMQALFYDDTEGSFDAVGYTISNSVIVNGSVPDTQPFYRFSAWLFIGHASESVSSWHRTGEIELDADLSGKVQLNLERYADAWLHEVETPVTSIVGPALCTVINRPAYLLYGQKWGEVLERMKNFRSPGFRILKGGMLPRDFADNKDELPEYLTERFLTHRTKRYINSKQFDWLYWYCNEDAASVTLKATVYMSNGFTYSTNRWTSGAVKAGRTYQMKADASILGILPPIGELVKYTLELDGITDQVTFMIDENHLDCFFEFENTFGARESFKFKGSRSTIAAISKLGFRKALPFDHANDDTDLHSTDELVGMQLTCNTGPLSAMDARAMADFIRSRHRWLVVRTDLVVPARILGGEALLENLNLEGDYSRDVEFTVELGVSKGV